MGTALKKRNGVNKIIKAETGRKNDPERERALTASRTATLEDYVRWIGDCDFETLPFREADALVLCIASYFDLTTMFASGTEEVSLRECAEPAEQGRLKLMITGGDMGNRGIFLAAAKSKRFGELIITDYVDRLSCDPPLQFAAMCFSFKDRFSFIAFRGTDSSLAGWRENFMISFTRTTAQTLAGEYASALVGRGRDWYIGGHSKGGNMALFAACVLSPEQLENVKKIYLLDGPGFCPEVFDEMLIRRVEPRTVRIIPEFDVIGKLFEPRIGDTRIVKSYRSGIEEHSLASWMIDHGELSAAAANDPGSRWISELMDEWIAGISLEERAVFVDELFDAMEEAGISDFQKISPEYFGNLLARIRGKSPTTKKILGSLPRKVILDDAGKKPLREQLPGLLKNPLLLSAIVMILVGIGVFFISDKILEIASIALVSVAAAVQLFIIIRRVIKAGVRAEGLRERIVITIVLLALIPVLIIKEQAMFVFGSAIFGITFLVLSYISGDRAAKESNVFVRVLNIVECVGCAGLGISFLVVPMVAVRPFAIGIGIGLLTDAVVRLAFFIWQTVRKNRIPGEIKL